MSAPRSRRTIRLCGPQSVVLSVYDKLFIRFIGRITRLQDDKVRMEFLDRASGNVEMTMQKHQYTIEEYERAAVRGGMKPESWKKLFATRDAVEHMGESFWQPRHDHQPYALFIVRKE